MERMFRLWFFANECDEGGKGVGHRKELSSNALRLGAMVTSNGFSTASLVLKNKQKERGEKKQHKKVMEEED